MIRREKGHIFSIQKGPNGSTVCVPINDGAEQASSKVCHEDEVEDGPVVPPRNIRCFVCLGHIKDADEYMECKCGRFYHIPCARRIKSCPMCGNALVEEVT